MNPTAVRPNLCTELVDYYKLNLGIDSSRWPIQPAITQLNPWTDTGRYLVHYAVVRRYPLGLLLMNVAHLIYIREPVRRVEDVD
jgi:hypothetical protein